MIVHVCDRGFSFKGAGKYYLHDKRDDKNRVVTTTERVGFIYAHNLQTEATDRLDAKDAKNAINMMAYTAMNAEALKQQAGVSTKGRKATLGEVYSYSLSWDTDKSPDEQTMMDAAMASLKFLKLDKEHQALIVQHTDTAHDHVHIIVNLVSPVNGKIANVGNDHVKFSDWGEQYEREHGGIVCEKRVENNKKRRALAKEKQRRKAQRQAEREAKNAWEKSEREKEQQASKNGQSYEKKPFKKWERDTGVVKHKQKIDKAQIQQIYLSAQSAAEFQEELDRAGYTLSRGDKRGLVLVNNETGKTHSLSRQISGLWKKEKSARRWMGGLENRFSDFDKRGLLSVEDTRKMLKDRQSYFDRDRYAAEQQARDEQAGIEHAKQQDLKAKKEFGVAGKKKKEKAVEAKKQATEPFYKEVDRMRKWEEWASQKRETLKKQQAETYKRKEALAEIKDLEKQVAANDNIIGRMSGKLQALQDELEERRLTLASADQRIAEQTAALDKKIQQNKPAPISDKPIDLEAEKRRRLEDLKARQAQIRERFKREAEQEQDKDREQERDHDLSL